MSDDVIAGLRRTLEAERRLHVEEEARLKARITELEEMIADFERACDAVARASEERGARLGIAATRAEVSCPRAEHCDEYTSRKRRCPECPGWHLESVEDAASRVCREARER